MTRSWRPDNRYRVNVVGFCLTVSLPDNADGRQTGVRSDCSDGRGDAGCAGGPVLVAGLPVTDVTRHQVRQCWMGR